MAEYINKQTALDAILAEYPDAHYPEWYAAKIKVLPAADVMPASQERTYKDLLDALLEDVQNLKTTLSDACCMCTKGECDNCNLRAFEDELSAILGRAAERKKRLAD